MKKVLVLALAMTLAGCGEPRIDTSSDDALKGSIQRVRNSLDGEDRANFDELVAEATVAAAMGKALGGEGTLSSTLSPINGMTGGEALAFKRQQALKVATEREEKDRKELAQLEEVEAKNRAGAALVSRIQITSPEIVEKKLGFSSRYVITASVKNTLDIPLEGLTFNYAVQSPNRAVPWDRGSGGFMIDGGLEPGEERRVDAISAGGSLMGFSAAARAMKDHSEAELILVVTDAGDANGNSIVGDQLSEWQVKRIEELRNQLRNK